MAGRTPDELIEQMMPHFQPRGTGGAWNLIMSLQLSTGDGTFLFTGLTRPYNTLFWLGSLRSDRASGWDYVACRVNGYSGANDYCYKVSSIYDNNSVGGTRAQNATYMIIAYCEGNTAAAGSFSPLECFTTNALSVNINPYVVGKSVQFQDYNANTDLSNGWGGGMLKYQEAVSSVEFFPCNGTNFKQYSSLCCYGVTQ